MFFLGNKYNRGTEVFSWQSLLWLKRGMLRDIRQQKRIKRQNDLLSMSSFFWLQAGLRNQRRRCSGLLALKNCVSHWASNFPLCCSLKKEKRLLSAPMKKGNIPKLKWKIRFTYHARLCTDQTANINNIIIFQSPNYPALPLIPGNLEVKISPSFFHEQFWVLRFSFIRHFPARW